jgi:hypothetical protein
VQNEAKTLANDPLLRFVPSWASRFQTIDIEHAKRSQRHNLFLLPLSNSQVASNKSVRLRTGHTLQNEATCRIGRKRTMQDAALCSADDPT